MIRSQKFSRIYYVFKKRLFNKLVNLVFGYDTCNLIIYS